MLAPGPAKIRSIDRIARIAVAVASAWYLLAISWGMFGRVAAGHDAVVAARAIAADNMLTWHLFAPVREYTIARPSPRLYYAHHPWGSFWTITAFTALLGRHAYVPRLVAVLTSGATPPLLYGIGRALWGPVPGALSAIAYTTLPIALAFGNFPGFEVPLVTSCLLVTWGFIRFAETRKWRWASVSLSGVIWCVNADWEAYVFLAVVIAVLAVAVFFFHPPWLGRTGVRQFGQWAALAAVAAGASVIGYLAYFQSIDALGDFFAQEVKRSQGNGTPLLEVLYDRRQWIDATFTPLAVLVGKIALPLFVLRFLALRRPLEVFPLALLAMAVVEYVKFKNGADVHIYWPHPFAPYYALSLGVVAEGASGLARRGLSFFDRERWVAAVPAITLLGIGLVPLAILPDGVRALRYARMTGGRFNENGNPTRREEDKSQALEWMTRRVPGRTPVAVHEGMHPTWAQAWALRRPMEATGEVLTGQSDDGQRLFVGDLAFMASMDQLKLAQSRKIVAVGPYVLADRAAPGGPAEGYVFDEREPNAWEWYWLSGTEPIRTIRPDPFYTWELREHYGQTPNPALSDLPASPEELRIAHNMAVAAGNAPLARQYEEKLLARVDPSAATSYDDGTRLLGCSYVPGVAPTLTVYFRSVGPARADFEFEIASIVEAGPAFSLVSRDDKLKELGAAFVLPPRLWKPEFIYAERTEIQHRPGRERFVGHFRGVANEAPPRPLDGSTSVRLLVLP